MHSRCPAGAVEPIALAQVERASAKAEELRAALLQSEAARLAAESTQHVPLFQQLQAAVEAASAREAASAARVAELERNAGAAAVEHRAAMAVRRRRRRRHAVGDDAPSRAACACRPSRTPATRRCTACLRPTPTWPLSAGASSSSKSTPRSVASHAPRVCEPRARAGHAPG
jgi:hypothetical protein